jgi:environmental stress-induced protein Ves
VLQLLPAADHKRMPWKNGGGETVEIAVFPPSASVDDFDWRVSMARVAGDGAFSVFPGVDRTLALLQGQGISLAIEQMPAALLTQQSAPFAFPADSATTAQLLDGPITDLNVMTRRGRWSHAVERCRHQAPLMVEAGSGLTMLLALGPVRLTGADWAADLAPLDAALFDGGVVVVPENWGEYFLIRLRPVDVSP